MSKIGSSTIRKIGVGSSRVHGGFVGYTSLGSAPDRIPTVGIIDAGQYADELPTELAAYTPLLGGEVFNVVTGYSADPTGATDSTAAIRAAIAASKAWTIANANAPVTVYFPEGTYKVIPDGSEVSPGYCFNIDFSNVTLEGDGPDKTTFFFRAWGDQDPAITLDRRGGLFSRIGGAGNVANLRWRGFRASGGASVTVDAGVPNEAIDNVYQPNPTGWDIFHKGIAISASGQTTGVTIDHCEFDNWRGECIWSGGGTELGSQNVYNCVIRQSNASAISNGGGVTVDNCHIYDVYNATECFAYGYSDPLATGQFLEVTNCVIEINRNLPTGLRIGKFGVVYLGFTYCHLTVEDCVFGDTNQGAVAMGEGACNVSIQRNTFTDTIGPYAIAIGSYPGAPEGELYRWENWVIADNTFHAETKNIDSAIVGFIGVDSGDNWQVTGNTVQNTGAFSVGIFMNVANGPTGTFLVDGNTIDKARPLQALDGPRPLFTNNVLTGGSEDGETFFSYDATPDPFEISPSWGPVDITDSAALQHQFTLALPSLFPEGFAFRLERVGNGAAFYAVEVKPDASWNTLTRGYMLTSGGILNMVKNASGKFDFVSFTPNTVSIPTHSEGIAGLDFYGQLSVNLSPSVAHVFSGHTGVAIGETVTINYNANTTIDHVPGNVEMSTGVDFVASGTGSLSATRDAAGVLQVTIP